jgi:catechol 2,3-dioxygenase-like lactoylglutathione lyase family enzyme
MIAHTGLAVSKFGRAKKFYRAVLKSLGYRQNMEYGPSAGFFDGKNTDFWIHKTKRITPMHLAFQAKNAKQVQAFHKKGLDAGGKDNGAPGYREYSPGYYAAFIIDLDGHNIEAVWYDPKGTPKAGSKKRKP